MQRRFFDQLIDSRDSSPSVRALTTIDQSGRESSLSFADLVDLSSRLGQQLVDAGANTGEVVLLLLDDLEMQVAAFLGCLSRGPVPAILPLPVAEMTSGYRTSIQDRIRQSQARMLVTTEAIERRLAASGAQLDCDILVPGKSLQQHGPVPDAVHSAEQRSSNDTVFVQFSSGTTGTPKAFAVAHGALDRQLRHYAEAIRVGPDDVSVSWSPLYHDQGLVSNLLMPLSRGIHTVLMSPQTWLKKPVRFFEAVSRHHGSISRWPNFAFLYMATRVSAADMEGLNIESLRLIANSGEPLTPDAWPRFKNNFAPFGLREGVMNGSYGMAENCLCVAVSPLDEPLHSETVLANALTGDGVARLCDQDAEGSRTLVASGKALPGTTIRVFDAEGTPCPDRTIGEIGILGDCLITHLYPDTALDESCFYGDFYRTGDMGYLVDGWLFVVGRKKDMVIVGGSNIFPEEVERVGATIPEVKPGRLIALGLPDRKLGTEQLVAVCELRNDTEANREQVRAALQRRVIEELSVWVKQVHFRQPGWIEKTTSGKLSRVSAREKLVAEMKESEHGLSTPEASRGRFSSGFLER